jgi:hypothetical protein
MTKLLRVKWTSHLAGTGEREVCAELFWYYVKERNYLKYLCIKERIIFKNLLKEWNGIGEKELDSSVSGYGTVFGC